MFSKSDFYLFKWIAWTLAFAVTSYLMEAYERIMNYAGSLTINQILVRGAAATTYKGTTNLFNEGVIGYSILALIAFEAVMWFRELLSLQKTLHSLIHLTLKKEVNT